MSDTKEILIVERIRNSSRLLRPTVTIAGASLFPTIAAVNPTVTLSALALRKSDYIVSERAALIA